MERRLFVVWVDKRKRREERKSARLLVFLLVGWQVGVGKERWWVSERGRLDGVEDSREVGRTSLLRWERHDLIHPNY